MVGFRSTIPNVVSYHCSYRASIVASYRFMYDWHFSSVVFSRGYPFVAHQTILTRRSFYQNRNNDVKKTSETIEMKQQPYKNGDHDSSSRSKRQQQERSQDGSAAFSDRTKEWIERSGIKLQEFAESLRTRLSQSMRNVLRDSSSERTTAAPLPPKSLTPQSNPPPSSPTATANTTGSKVLWERTKALSNDALESMKQATSSAASATTAAISNKVQSTTRSVSAKTRNAIQDMQARAKSRVQESLRHAMASTSTALSSAWMSVKQPIRELYESAKEKLGSVSIWNRFWWWSLAAIGVYGVATTLPREIARKVFDKNDDDDPHKKE